MNLPYRPLDRSSPPPASGAWRPGHEAGHRRFLSLGPFTTSGGIRLPEVVVAYECWGRPEADGRNAVYVCHALTGDSHLTGPAGAGHRTAGWWEGLVGPGRALDTDRWFVVCANVLGGCQGTTGPASPAPDGRPWGQRFPTVTIADQVAIEMRFTRALGLPRWALVVGPSMGGMRLLEWMFTAPEQVGSGLVIGATASVTADQIGSHEAQIAAITADAGFRGGDYYELPDGQGPHRGLGVARRIAHLSYRSAEELHRRFGRSPQPGEDPWSWKPEGRGGRFAVASYLDHQAEKLVHRFDANSYVRLTRAMSLFDLGHGRGGTEQALAAIRVPFTVVGMDTDRLFPLEQQRRIVEAAPAASGLEVIRSLHGHDGFLVETGQMGRLVRRHLEKLAGGS